MRKPQTIRRLLVGASVLVGGGTLLGNGCANALYSIQWCGTVITGCTPTDQINLTFGALQVPDYFTDPSCTIPLGCGSGDVLPPLVDGPGGEAPDQPADDQGGGVGGGGAGGGGV